MDTEIERILFLTPIFTTLIFSLGSAVLVALGITLYFFIRLTARKPHRGSVPAYRFRRVYKRVFDGFIEKELCMRNRFSAQLFNFEYYGLNNLWKTSKL